MTQRRALVLSGPFGMGHAIMADAAEEVLRAGGWQVRRRDSMQLLGPAAGRAGDALFHRLLGVPGLYDALHFAHLRTGSRLAVAMDRWARRQLLPALRAELDAHPADLVLSVFATGASAAAALKREAPERRTVVLCTDVAVHRLWVHDGTDLFLVTSRAAEAAVRRFRPDASVCLVPAPVRAEFCAPPPQREARTALGLDPAARCVLFVDSGWGFGPTVRAAERLGRAGVEVLAVAGHRRELERRLRQLAVREPHVHPFGFTDRMPTLMSAADVVVALPGANTCNEARHVGRTLVLLDLMPGHGRDNLQHELDLGNAYVAGPDVSATVRYALSTLGATLGPGRATGDWSTAFTAALAGVGIAAARTGPTWQPTLEDGGVRR